MKSALGLLGLTVVVGACGGNGDALFEPVGGSSSGATGGQAMAGNAGSSSSGGRAGSAGNATGGSLGDGGDGGGGAAGSGGKPSGGAGSAGTGGDEPVAGDDTGPPEPEVIFVAPSGADSDDCGMEAQSPCKSITRGVARAAAAKRDSVFVQAGTYTEVLVLGSGIAVIGGFDSAWMTGDRNDEQHQVRITGGIEESSKALVAVWAHDLEEPATLENLLVVGPDATAARTGSLNGLSSYGIHAVAAKLNLKDVDITAGNGGNGSDGAPGEDAVTTAVTDEMNATVGDNGNAMNVTCSVAVSGGGSQGLNSCSSSPSQRLMDGGKGGDGGARDKVCTAGDINYEAQPGASGADAAFRAGEAGKGGKPGTGGGPATPSNGECSAAGPGGAGAVVNGAGGKAASGGALTDNFWFGAPGGAGETGENGAGGGGGGGGGGCDISLNGSTTDARGAGGGGGGAGGCAARGGGAGGGGGGGSFGIFAVGSAIDVSGVTVTLGVGGNGGKGGTGGQGQSGGAGSDGGTHPQAGAPGRGGNGGHGGHGGGGAGGAGGVSVGIALWSSSTLTGEAETSGGTPGLGGSGGASAPTAPEDERDGNAGEDGAPGTTHSKLDCAAGTCS